MKDILFDVTHNEEGLSTGQYTTIISLLEILRLKIDNGYNNLMWLPHKIYLIGQKLSDHKPELFLENKGDYFNKKFLARAKGPTPQENAHANLFHL